jgi:hypothetical protein
MKKGERNKRSDDEETKREKDKWRESEVFSLKSKFLRVCIPRVESGGEDGT